MLVLDNTWVEVDVELFRQKQDVWVESVRRGSDYDGSFDGINLLGECISRLQWVEFLSNDVLKYWHEVCILILLKKAISKKQQEECRKLLQSFRLSSSKMSSKTFHYWNSFLKMVKIVVLDNMMSQNYLNTILPYHTICLKLMDS